MIYMLDTNVFLNAKERYYGFETAPGFWDWLDHAHDLGKVCSNVSVYSEIVIPGKPLDDVGRWAAKRLDSFFLPLPADLTEMSGHISRWAQSKHKKHQYTEFSRGADQNLIMHANAGGFVVVTHETKSRPRKKIKIPVVCDEFGIECIDTFEMLRREKVRLGLLDYSKESP